MKPVTIFLTTTLAFVAIAEAQLGGLTGGLTSGLGGSGGSDSESSLGPSPYRGFPVKKVWGTRTYNSGTNTFKLNNGYFAQGQTRDADVVGVNVRALPRFLAGIGNPR